MTAEATCRSASNLRSLQIAAGVLLTSHILRPLSRQRIDAHYGLGVQSNGGAAPAKVHWMAGTFLDAVPCPPCRRTGSILAAYAAALPAGEKQKACRGRRCGRLPKVSNNGWEEDCRCSIRLPLGGGAGRLRHEALREEVHRFDVLIIPKNAPTDSVHIAVQPCVCCNAI
jgi:hypothetical protein